MPKLFTDMTVDGFESGQTDFPTRLQQDNRGQEFLDRVINPAVATMTSAAETVFIVITGHSDRVDDAGLSREQRRVKELDASAKRTESAKAEVVRSIEIQLISQGLTVEAQMKDRLQFVELSMGAAQLEKSGDVLSSADRLLNRRVNLQTVRFVP